MFSWLLRALAHACGITASSTSTASSGCSRGTAITAETMGTAAFNSMVMMAIPCSMAESSSPRALDELGEVGVLEGDERKL